MNRNIIIGFGSATPFNTQNQWGLITTDINIATPKPKVNYVDIPYGEGALDLTQSLTGEVNYYNRKISLSFDLIELPVPRQVLVDKIMNEIHGHKLDLVLPDSPLWLYRGRVSVNSVKTSMILNKLVLDVETEPYRLKLSDTVYNFTVTSTEQTLILKNSRMRVTPVVVTDKAIVIKFGTQTFNLGIGTHRLVGFVLVQGDNTIKLSGTVGAKVKITYREGSL